VTKPPDFENNSMFWISLAEEAIAQAQQVEDKDQKALLLRIAESYREIGRITQLPKAH